MSGFTTPEKAQAITAPTIPPKPQPAESTKPPSKKHRFDSFRRRLSPFSSDIPAPAKKNPLQCCHCKGPHYTNKCPLSCEYCRSLDYDPQGHTERNCTPRCQACMGWGKVALSREFGVESPLARQLLAYAAAASAVGEQFLEERWPYLSAEQKMQLEGAVDQIRAGSNMARRILMKVAEEGAA